MVRVVTTYEAELDPARLAEHVEVCRRIPGASVRHGPVQRTLFGRPLRYVVEFEFATDEDWQRVAKSDEVKAAASDAAAMGVEHSVYVLEID